MTKLEIDQLVLLVVTAKPNYETGKVEYDWDFPDNCDSSRMLGILELIKHDLLHHWEEKMIDENENQDN